MLVHHDPGRNIWIELDVSKKFDFGAMLFCVREGEEQLPEKK